MEQYEYSSLGYSSIGCTTWTAVRYGALQEYSSFGYTTWIHYLDTLLGPRYSMEQYGAVWSSMNTLPLDALL